MPNGKICYIEIPSTDIVKSAAFYAAVFGWTTRTRGDGAVAFDDATGGVSGSWVKGRKPSTDVGLMTYVMVDSIDSTLKAVAAAGGKVHTPKSPTDPGGGAFAIFADPAGNLIGLYQEPPKKA